MRFKTLPNADATDGGRDARRDAALAALFGSIALLAGADLVLDVGEGASLVHVLTEAALLLSALLGLAAMLHRLGRLRAEAADLTVRLKAKTVEAAAWRADAQVLVAGLGVAIDQQFSRWSLSPAEKEVALLLLKGMSHKEVATIRGIGEATARQQARAVYKKAGLSGRHDLAAFFLEDLLLPAPSGLTTESSATGTARDSPD